MADTKLTALSAIGAIADEDLFYVVDDPSGTPAGLKATGTQLKTYMGTASGAAKAWVVFVGTGTVTINASFNITSITDNGTGLYTINIATDFSTDNYGIAS